MKLNQRMKYLLYGSNIWYLGEGMLGPLFAVFSEQVGGNILDITWAWATYLIVSGLLHIVVGKWLEKKNITGKVMIVGYGLNALFTFAYLWVSEPWHLFAVQTGLGVAAALATTTWQALFAKNMEHETFEWGLADGQAKIFTGLATILGGYVVSLFSFSALFVLMGVIQVVATVYQAQFLYAK